MQAFYWSKANIDALHASGYSIMGCEFDYTDQKLFDQVASKKITPKKFADEMVKTGTIGNEGSEISHRIYTIVGEGIVYATSKKMKCVALDFSHNQEGGSGLLDKIAAELGKKDKDTTVGQMNDHLQISSFLYPDNKEIKQALEALDSLKIDTAVKIYSPEGLPKIRDAWLDKRIGVGDKILADKAFELIKGSKKMSLMYGAMHGERGDGVKLKDFDEYFEDHKGMNVGKLAIVPSFEKYTKSILFPDGDLEHKEFPNTLIITGDNGEKIKPYAVMLKGTSIDGNVGYEASVKELMGKDQIEAFRLGDGNLNELKVDPKSLPSKAAEKKR